MGWCEFLCSLPTDEPARFQATVNGFLAAVYRHNEVHRGPISASTTGAAWPTRIEAVAWCADDLTAGIAEHPASGKYLPPCFCGENRRSYTTASGRPAAPYCGVAAWFVFRLASPLASDFVPVSCRAVLATLWLSCLVVFATLCDSLRVVLATLCVVWPSGIGLPCGSRCRVVSATLCVSSTVPSFGFLHALGGFLAQRFVGVLLRTQGGWRLRPAREGKSGGSLKCSSS